MYRLSHPAWRAGWILFIFVGISDTYRMPGLAPTLMVKCLILE